MTQEPKWTPGPWAAQKAYGHDPEHIFWNIRPKGSLWETVASAWCNRSPESRVTRDAMDANANLIAAAPELYEALTRALNFIENTECEMGEVMQCGDSARAALAKARGETE